MKVKSNSKFYIRIPKSVALDSRYNATDKYIFGALLSLAVNVKNKGFKLYTSDLSRKINVSKRVLQYTVNRLATLVDRNADFTDGPLITIEQDKKSRYRIIYVNNYDKDAYCLIPGEIVADQFLSIQSKIFYGQAFVTRPGFRYERIWDIAEHTNYHRASVYRHIQILIKTGYLMRDTSVDGYRFIARDSYSKQLEIRRNESKEKVWFVGERANQKIENAPPKIEVPVHVKNTLDAIWDQINKRK